MTAARVPCAVVDVLDAGTAVATVTIAGEVPRLFLADTLARLELAAQTLGWTVRLRSPDPGLTEVLDLTAVPAHLTDRPSPAGPVPS